MAAVAELAADATSASGPGFAGEVDLYGFDIPSDDEEDREQQSTMAYFAPIPSPPEQEYKSFAAVEKELSSFSRRHGEVAKSGSLKKGPTGTILRGPFCCAIAVQDSLAQCRAKRDAASLQQQRNKPSRLTGCPFTVTICTAEKDKPEGPHRIVFDMNQTHKHPAVNAIGLTNHRHANRMEIWEFLQNARHSQIESRKVCTMAKREFNARYSNAEKCEMVAPVLRDIYNEWAKVRSETLQVAALVERTMEILQQEDFFHRSGINDNRIEALFFAHPRVVEIFKDNPDVVMMDCTYKTNNYALPLLCFVTITQVGIAMPVAHAFLHAEHEASYTWALDCLRDMINQYHIEEPSVIVHDRDRALIRGLEAVFPGIPHLLCLWHMNEDVKANANATFGMQRLPEGRWVMSPQGEAFLEMYKSCINAKTVEDFGIACNELKSKHSDPEWQKMARYLEIQWWSHKELCVTAWTDNIRHYVTSTTPSHTRRRWIGILARKHLWR